MTAPARAHPHPRPACLYSRVGARSLFVPAGRIGSKAGCVTLGPGELSFGQEAASDSCARVGLGATRRPTRLWPGGYRRPVPVRGEPAPAQSQPRSWNWARRPETSRCSTSASSRIRRRAASSMVSMLLFLQCGAAGVLPDTTNMPKRSLDHQDIIFDPLTISYGS